MSGVEIRDLRADETALLREMLYIALAWNPKRRLPPKVVLLRLPQLTMFYKGWGRAGDTALVAEDVGRRIGLVWYRLFTEAVHGEGFVDEETPEVAIAVLEDQRARGVSAPRSWRRSTRVHARTVWCGSRSASTVRTPRGASTNGSGTSRSSRTTRTGG